MYSTITLHKQDGATYRGPLKAYDVRRGGEFVGTLQTWGRTWEVYDAGYNQVASHTTIKAATRVAGRLLVDTLPDVPPLIILPPLGTAECPACDGYGYFDGGDDDDPAPVGCLACGGAGEVNVCAGCGTVPQVVNGREHCHCAAFTEWEVAA